MPRNQVGRRAILAAILLASSCESSWLRCAGLAPSIDVAHRLTVVVANCDARTVVVSSPRRREAAELSALARANESPAGAERGLDGDVGGVGGCKVPACSIHTIPAARLLEQNENNSR